MVVELNFIPVEDAIEEEWLYADGGHTCLLMIQGNILQASYDASRNQFYVHDGYPVLPMDSGGFTTHTLYATNDPEFNMGIKIDGVAPSKVQ